MRLLKQDPANGVMKMQIESEDDVWHLYNVLESGDLVIASTTRREEKSADKLRAERGEKRRMTLGIRVEKIEFSDFDLRLRVLGVIEEGPQDVGQHHTLIFETGDILTLSKEHWRETQVDRLRRAMDDSRKPQVVFVAMDRDEATIAVLRQFGMKELALVRSGRSGKQYEERGSGDDYFGEIAAKLESVLEDGTPLVVLGPGFAKESLIEEGKQRFPEIFSRASSYHTGQTGMAGIHEMMKRGMGAEVLRDSRVAMEVKLMESLLEGIGKDGLATYGPGEVEVAAQAGAVETLLILDSLLRERDLDRLVAAVEAQRGDVVVVSEQHDAGKSLDSLGGVAALLRYQV